MYRRRYSKKEKSRVSLWVLAAVFAATSSVNITAAQAADTHGFPRTFHVWSCSSPDLLARYDMVVGNVHCDIARMRSLNPNGVFLLQPGLDLGTSGYNNVHTTYGAQYRWKGGSDSISDGSAANLGSMRAFDPEWDYLRNADGSIATINSSYSHTGWNLADPLRKGTPDLIAKLIAYAAKQRKLYRNGWDGIYGDNWTYGYIGESWYYGPKLDADRNGVADELTTLRKNFDTNLVRVGHLLRSYLPGKIVGGNGNHIGADAYYGSEVDGWLRSANFTQIEHIEDKYRNNPGGLVSKVRRWLDYPDPLGHTRYLATVQNALKCDGSDFLVASASDPNQNQYILDACVMKSMRWGLTLVLLTNGYYEVYPYALHGALWWYDEYDGGDGIRKRGYLGMPLNDPQKLANGVWRRDFQNGVALNNSTTSTQTVSLGATYKRLKGTQNPTLNNGAQVTQVSIPEHDGAILLRASGGTTSPPPPPAPSSAPQPPAAPSPKGSPIGTSPPAPPSAPSPPPSSAGGSAPPTVSSPGRDADTRTPRRFVVAAKVRGHRVTFTVARVRCKQCRALLRLRLPQRTRVVRMRRIENRFRAVLRRVPSGRWRYGIALIGRNGVRRGSWVWGTVRVP